MKKFSLQFKEVWLLDFTVEANSIEEAYEKISKNHLTDDPSVVEQKPKCLDREIIILHEHTIPN